MRPVPLLLSLVFATHLSACGDKDGGTDGTTVDGGTADGGTGDGGTADGGTSDGGTSDGGTTVDDDLDDDGFSVADGDCDDGDAAIYPGAADEPYDGIDSDCDGASDYDWDGDGYDSADHGGDDCHDLDPEVYPGAPDAPYDGIDSDCAEDSDFDADGDGADAEGWGGEDCDDDDASFGPDAYDRPDDGLDQDCDGVDRSFDGVVVDEGETTSFEIEVPVSGLGGLDVAVLLDTTCSMSSALNSLDFGDFADAVAHLDVDLQVGFATYDDYYFGSYGTSVDRPFIMRQQITDDMDAVQAALEDTSLHSGSDGPEASMEALYQALTGTGYDQDCDGEWDDSTDVLPFLASDDDPFGGDAGEAWDADSSGGGDIGGMGFRDGATPLIFFITDNTLRDPDGLVSSSTGSPGGCPDDAGSEAVADAASDAGAWLFGIAAASTPLDDMQILAEMTGSSADLDGDGVDDELAQRWSSREDLGTVLGEYTAALAEELAQEPVISEMWLEPSLDAYSLITDISPDPATDVDTASTDTVTFTVTLYGGVPATVHALDVTLYLDLYIEGDHTETFTVLVEIPPA